MKYKLKAAILSDDIQVIDAKLDGLLLDLYPLTIANAPLPAGEQREFAEDVAKHIGAIRQILVMRVINVSINAAPPIAEDG